MAPLETVTIAGGGGQLGRYIVRAFLTSKDRFAKIQLLTQSIDTDLYKEFAQKGAKLILWNDENESEVQAALKDTDIVVNAIGSFGYEHKNKLVKSLNSSRVRLYFPSEFGVDHRIHDFSSAEWDKKKKHDKIAKDFLPPTAHVCHVYVGLFLEHSFGPWYGFSSKNRRYEILVKKGSARKDHKVTYTSKEDIGRALVELSLMKDPPEHVRLNGDSKSAREVANEMEKEGSGPIEIVEADLDDYKKAVLADTEYRPDKQLRFMMGEGKIDHSLGGLGNDNELVNPGEKGWKWRGVAEIAKETGGKPHYKTELDALGRSPGTEPR